MLSQLMLCKGVYFIYNTLRRELVYLSLFIITVFHRQICNQKQAWGITRCGKKMRFLSKNDTNKQGKIETRREFDSENNVPSSTKSV